MIKITANTKDNVVELIIKVSGPVEEIGEEATQITRHLAEQLLEEAEPAFHILKDNIAKLARESLEERLDKILEKDMEESNVKCN